MRRLALTLAGFVLAGAFYLLLVDTASLPELYVLIAVALIATVAFEAAREQGFPEARFSLRWLRAPGARSFGSRSTRGLLCREALAQLRSASARAASSARFRSRRAPASSDRGRYALTEIVGSLAPNTIVIGVDTDSDLLLVHQLHRHGRPATSIDVLGLG